MSSCLAFRGSVPRGLANSRCHPGTKKNITRTLKRREAQSCSTTLTRLRAIQHNAEGTEGEGVREMQRPSHVSAKKRKTKNNKILFLERGPVIRRFSTFEGALLNLTQRKARDDGIQAFSSRK